MATCAALLKAGWLLHFRYNSQFIRLFTEWVQVYNFSIFTCFLTDVIFRYRRFINKIPSRFQGRGSKHVEEVQLWGCVAVRLLRV
jgi:hypothetical protein